MSQNLSTIEESSPHTSIISARSNPRKSGLSTYAPDHHDHRRPSYTGTDSPSTPSRLSQGTSTTDRPIAYSGSRTSLGEQDPRPSRHDSVTDVSESKSSRIPIPVSGPSREYWSNRTDLHPIRSSSKKGNVLRKKSLRRHEVYVMAAT
jgi:hypothetical protein